MLPLESDEDVDIAQQQTHGPHDRDQPPYRHPGHSRVSCRRSPDWHGSLRVHPNHLSASSSV